MKKVLIDTDVILDFFFEREPFSDNAAKVLSQCERKIIVGYVTPVILSNVYYLLSKNTKPEKVIEKLKKLLIFLDVLTIDKRTIVAALNSEFKDFEDAIQNYAAEINDKVDIIITRNTKDYRKSKLAIMNPNEFLKL